MRRILYALVLLGAVAPASASAQTRTVTADAVKLLTVPCAISSGTASPIGGADCDVYLKSDGTLWQRKSGAWIQVGAAGAPLTKTNDTNVTVTLGGSPSVALVNAASLTMGWTGQLGLTRGGTGASLTASTGGIVYSGASALGVMSGTSTAGQMLRSGASAAPAWSTATWPATATPIGAYLRADGTNWVISALTLPNAATQGDLVVATAANTWGAVAAAAAGKVLRAGGVSTVPAWSTATYPDVATATNSFLRADGTNWTASTLKLPNAATQGDLVVATGANTWGAVAAATVGKILQGAGASTVPAWSTATYPSVGTATNSFLRADGTNWVASALKLPNAATQYYMPFATATNTWGESSSLLFNSSTTTLTVPAVKHPSFVSQTSYWGIDATGGADFRSVFTDEMHAKSFIADLEQALAGGQIVPKGVAVITSLTCPAAGATATLTVEDLPSAPDMQVFQASDWVAVRTFSRAAGALTIADCVGTVSAPNTGGSGTQTWTFTRGSGGSAGSMAASTVVPAKTLALDYGVSGNGYYEVNSIDGTYGANSPYAQVVTWATAPVAANRTVRARLGQLSGITGTNEYGLFAGTYAATNGAYFRASGSNFDLNGITAKWWDGTTNVITIAPNAGAPYLGIGNPAPSTYGSTGIWFGKDGSTYKASIGDANTYVRWDGSTLAIKGSVTVTSGNALVTGGAATDVNNNVTTINGGKITAGTITTSQLNFTPIQTSNVIASINASAEGLDIAADRISIAGTTTFATGYDPTTKIPTGGARADTGWSAAGDTTKIDGADIYAGSVTTAALNFTPATVSNIVATINASAEGLDIAADRVSIAATTTFASGYNPTTKVPAAGAAADVNANVTTISGGKITAGTITTAQLNFTPVQTSNVVASINASAEGIRIAGNRITVDGTVSFTSGYDPTTKVAAGGAAADVNANSTTISGGKITTGSITTTQLNFTPVQSTDVIAKINASAEGLDISADRISIGGTTTFASGYNPTTKIASGGAAADVNANATTIDGGKITTHSITASKMVLMPSGTTINVDPYLQDSSVWAVTSGPALSFVSVTDAPVGSTVIRTTSGTTTTYFEDTTFYPIDRTNKTYRFSFWARRISGDGTLYADLRQFDSSYNPTTQGDSGRPPYRPSGAAPTTWTQYSYVYVTADWQATAKFVKIDIIPNVNATVAGVYEIANPRLEEMNGASLIVDGTITASALSATAIDGKTITGATVRTAASGARVALDSSGLIAYNSGGTAVTTISTATGALTASGVSLTSGNLTVDANGIRIAPSTSVTADRIYGFTDHTAGLGYTFISVAQVGTPSAVMYSEDCTGHTMATYYYRVQAYNAQGLGAVSNYVTLSSPVSPDGLCYATVSWSPVPAADGYLLYRDSSSTASAWKDVGMASASTTIPLRTYNITTATGFTIGTYTPSASGTGSQILNLVADGGYGIQFTGPANPLWGAQTMSYYMDAAQFYNTGATNRILGAPGYGWTKVYASLPTNPGGSKYVVLWDSTTNQLYRAATTTGSVPEPIPDAIANDIADLRSQVAYLTARLVALEAQGTRQQ